IFQPEIRQGLARLGQRNLFSQGLREEDLDYMLKEIGRATENLLESEFGALIAIERNDSLAGYLESGVLVEAKVSADLIEAIFTPNNPLHDGAVIIQHGRIMAAGCFFPLSENQDLDRIYGTRHRAALGLSEETDALLIIISEERKDMSLVYKGKLFNAVNKEEMLSKIKGILKLKSDEQN
ncbi:MAG: DNA integrity scanning protein DisA nucleotide-binding domain protein, partial [Candidatus Omnitrophota bacterium]